jgi:hypothetical protein
VYCVIQARELFEHLQLSAPLGPANGLAVFTDHRPEILARARVILERQVGELPGVVSISFRPTPTDTDEDPDRDERHTAAPTWSKADIVRHLVSLEPLKVYGWRWPVGQCAGCVFAAFFGSWLVVEVIQAIVEWFLF